MLSGSENDVFGLDVNGGGNGFDRRFANSAYPVSKYHDDLARVCFFTSSGIGLRVPPSGSVSDTYLRCCKCAPSWDRDNAKTRFLGSKM